MLKKKIKQMETNDKKVFVSGDEAIAIGTKLSRPHVISAYPITPQTIAVERLAEMVADGELDAEYMHVESEHSALSAAMGACSFGARTFTATSSQGLLYMAEVMHYASGGRSPIVMMNANRSVALPWSIYGDQRDSLSLLDSGWIQVYVEDAQEALDMIIQAYKIAEDNKVLTPMMVNIDGFILTHTYEIVKIPNQDMVDKFLPPFDTPVKMSFENPRNMGFSSQPEDNMEFKYQQHEAMMNAEPVIEAVDKEFGEMFGRTYHGMLEEYRCEDADTILFTLGSVVGTSRVVVDNLRKEGKKVGLVKIRYMRPFPEKQIQEIAKRAKAIGILEKDISFGYEGTVYTNVNSALQKAGVTIPALNFVAGLGGRDIRLSDIEYMFAQIEEASKGITKKSVEFINLNVDID